MGRDKQLYDNEFRLVAGCIPYRLKKDHTGILEVLMISSPNRDDLVFPKGGWEKDENVWEAARRETFEEAGVEGILNLPVEEAFRLCRYEWMRKALQEFLRVLSEAGKYQMRYELVEPSVVPVPVSEFSPSFFKKPSTTQQLNEPCKCIGVVGMMSHLMKFPALGSLLVFFLLLSVLLQLAYC